MKQNTKNLIVYLILAIILLSSIAIFTTKGNTGTYLNLTAEDSSLTITKENVLTNAKDYSKLDLSENWDESNVYKINLNGNEILTDANLEVKDSIVYIKDGGNYLINGILDNGQIIVYSEDRQSVRLILNGVNISSSSNAPITILNAEETIITLVEGTTNYLTDTGEYDNSSEDADSTRAAIYSKDDLYINGQGSLMINSKNKNGIQSKDQLVILNGNFEINATKEAIKAKDYIVIEDGNFNLIAGEDGIRVTEEEDKEKGFIIIENGNFNIESVRDGIQAGSYLIIEDGTFDITTTYDNPANSNNQGFNSRYSQSSTSLVSSKGIKSENYIEINNAQINIDSTNDGIHCDDAIIINSGDISISSGDDGIHANELIKINNGKIEIKKSYEGIESKNIYINGGDFIISASDDGLNVADGTGQTMRAISGLGLYISGGNIYINANGDGLDSNGDIYITGGDIKVDGPINSGNGALDCNGEFFMNEGSLIAVGSSGMAETPGQYSEQNSISIFFSETLESGTKIEVKSETNEIIFSFTSAKIFQSFVASSEELITGETYNIYIDGEFYEEITISNVVTQIGVSSGMGMGGGGMRGFR